MNNSLLAKQICVTGSIGSGKSRVCRYLAKLMRLPYVDIDDIAKEIMRPGHVGLQAIAHYDPAFLNRDGTLNRPLLRAEIFNSPRLKDDIDGLLHPLIHTALLDYLEQGPKKCVLEIPLLFETGWDTLFDTIIVVYASKETCLRRIMRRDGVTPRDAEKAHDSQMDPLFKKSKANFVVENEDDWSSTMDNIANIACEITG